MSPRHPSPVIPREGLSCFECESPFKIEGPMSLPTVVLNEVQHGTTWDPFDPLTLNFFDVSFLTSSIPDSWRTKLWGDFRSWQRFNTGRGPFKSGWTKVPKSYNEMKGLFYRGPLRLSTVPNFEDSEWRWEPSRLPPPIPSPIPVPDLVPKEKTISKSWVKDKITLVPSRLKRSPRRISVVHCIGSLRPRTQYPV